MPVDGENGEGSKLDKGLQEAELPPVLAGGVGIEFCDATAGCCC